MLDCCIPVLPSEPSTEFGIFLSKGSGSYPTPSGPMYVFVSRENEQMVPVREISKALKHLTLSENIFWEGVPDQSLLDVGTPVPTLARRITP
jgi:hypothetical protein